MIQLMVIPMNMQIQAVGQLFSVKKPAEVPMYRRAHSGIVARVQQFLDEKGHVDIAKKLSVHSKPKEFVVGIKGLKALLRDQVFAPQFASQIELDPHWMDLAILRAAKASDNLIEGVRQYYLPQSRVAIGNIENYSIKSVQQTIRICESLGLLKLVLDNGTERPQESMHWEQAEILASKWTATLAMSNLQNQRYKAVMAQLNAMKTELVDHPVFGEWHIHKMAVNGDSPEDLERVAEQTKKSWLASSSMRTVIFPFLSPTAATAIKDPQVARFRHESAQVRSLHVQFLDSLPESDPRVVIGRAQMSIEKIIQKKIPPGTWKRI